MRKYLLLLLMGLMVSLLGCRQVTTTNQDDLDTLKLNKLNEAIYMVDYPATQGQMITGDLALPTSYKDVTIAWETLNFPEIVSSTGKVTRPKSCWVESRDQQGIIKFPDINQNWPVILKATFSYQGMTETHKLLVVVKPADDFTCDKYLG